MSRTVIREATTSLAEKGLVAARQGWGTIVLDPSQWSLLDPMVLDTLLRRADRLEYLDNLIEIRTTLGPRSPRGRLGGSPPTPPQR